MEPILGQIALFPYNRIPKGWAKCDGKEYSLAANTALYSLLGTNFGGNGKTTYAVPNIPPIKTGGGEIVYCIALQGYYPATD